MKVRTEFHDGLEFEIPTWDKTPKPWNKNGAWAKDPALTRRLERALKAAVPNHEFLTTLALVATGDGSCHTFWGSHGCDLAKGHDGLCVCGANDPEGACSAGLKYGDSDTLILWWGRDSGMEISTHYWKWFT